MEQVAVVHGAERCGAHQRREHRHACFLRQGHGGYEVAGGHIADQGEDLVFVNELGRLLGLVRIVVRHQLQRAPVHAAGLVDLVERQRNARLVVHPEILGRAGEHGRLAYLDAGVRHAGFGGQCTVNHAQGCGARHCRHGGAAVHTGPSSHSSHPPKSHETLLTSKAGVAPHCRAPATLSAGLVVLRNPLGVARPSARPSRTRLLHATAVAAPNQTLTRSHSYTLR